MNITLRELIEGHAGGVRDGRTLKAVIPGGSSVPILMPDQLDTQASFDAIQKAGSLLGSAAIVVLDDTTCMVWLAENLLHFYRHESCGKCTPCREGTDWLYKILQPDRARRRADARPRSARQHLEQHRRQDAVRVRRRRRDAGADDAEAFPARVRSAHPAKAAARCPPTGARGSRWERTDAPRARTRTRRPSCLRARADSYDTAAHRPDRPDALRLRHAAELGGGDGVRRAQGRGAAAAAARADPRRPAGAAAAARRRHQADVQGGAAAAGGRSAPLRAGADHLRDRRLRRLRRRPVRRRDDVLRPARRAAAAAGRRRQRRGPGDLRDRVDERLRHRARRLELEQQVLAARRPALVGADDQLRAVVRPRARQRAAGRQLAVADRHRRTRRRAPGSGSCRAGSCSCSRSGS